MALSEPESKVLRAAFKQSMLRANERARGDYACLQYGGQEPLTVKLTTILSNKAGIGWTTFDHTGAPVQTSALGAGAERFNGYYDQTEICSKIMAATGLER
jgi:alkaline phosphatase